ncbi:xanthine dehydrogenase family protein molybdopterin-binding subunit [SAR202 cluster bacterium AD-802-E10_MRT_200m]|nr:xanthine dehydrogenase family protein molybdopterin-binding subunit [SAR202 cluster bacterium AD-802-E10_MRT_200m]
MTSYRTLGTSMPRKDGIDKVTGTAKYTADVDLPGMLWGKSLRSPYPHAKILSIDTSAATTVSGVHAVLTGRDVRGILYGRRLRDVPVLAWDHVRFVGERVAAVAAENEDIAQAALDLIKIEYEELPPLLDPLEAMGEGASLIHPDMLNYVGFPEPLEKPSNVFVQDVWGKGDVENGFAQADVIIKNTFTTSRQHQAYLEPNTCVVWVDADGIVQVWASNKTPYDLRQKLSDATGLSLNQFQINFATIGGDFGGKGSPMEVPLCYYLALASKRPVKMVMDYVDEFMAANPRHAAIIEVKTGVKQDGTMIAHHVRGVFDSGAYGGFKPLVNLRGFSHAGGPYKTPNVKIEALQVYTNNVPCGHMRGPGEPQAAFALESQMDLIARELNLDPLQIRIKNIIADGDEDALGHRFEGVQIKETLEAAVLEGQYGLPKARNVGRGIALGDRPPGGGEGHAAVTLCPGGFAVLGTPIFEQGAGSYSLETQVVAEELSISPDYIKIEIWNTGKVGFDSGVGGSRVTRVGTQVAYAATHDAIKQLLVAAAELLGVPEGTLSFRDGLISNDDTEETYLWGELLTRANRSITGQATIQDTGMADVTGYVAQVAEVTVDAETGQVELVSLTTAHDVGKIINPVDHQGQINGGVMQGIGYALMEELKVEDGRVTTLTFGDYKIPTTKDIPELRTVLVESDKGVGPYNVKSIGENPTIPVAAAVANAVEDAIGVRIKDLPVTAEKVYFALKQMRG